MRYRLFKEIRDLPTFEEAIILGGLPRQPEFTEDGDLFYHAPSGIAIIAVPEPGDDELTAAEYFAANPEPQRDDADALTDDEAAEISEASAAAANLFLKEMK